MEPVASVVDKLKGFPKSFQDFASNVFHWRHNSNRRSPIEILKRLQREAFSDVMKLRNRQDKMEQMLSFYKSSKGGPFQEASTRVRGEVDILQALFLMDNADQRNYDTIRGAAIRTGIQSRFTFESTIRQNDNLLVEFVASEKGQGDVLGCSLSLAKVFYEACISDWFSAVAIPVGAQHRDVIVATNSSSQRRGLTNYSSFGPPLLNQPNGSAIGLMVRKTNAVASLAHFVSGLGMQPGSAGIVHCFCTFAQIVCQLSRSTKLSLLGVHQWPKPSSQHFSLEVPGSIALVLESELDKSTRIGGWLEMKRSNPRFLELAVNVSDTPEDHFGWGLSLGGSIQGPRNWDHFQVETFLQFNVDKRFTLQPALIYVMNGTTQFPVLMLRSTWSL